MSLKSINPHNGQLINEYEEFSAAKLDDYLRKSCLAYGSWKEKTIAERANVIMRVARDLKSKKKELSKLMTLEMGKPIKEAQAEVDKCVWVCEYYAEHSAEFLKPRVIEAGFEASFVSPRPLGVILGVMPWNFPFWQVFRFAIPTLMAGNTALLKHSSNVSGVALEIEKLFLTASTANGLPEIFQTCLVPSSRMDELVLDKRIQAVSLTGSSKAGKKLAALSAQGMKRGVYELGGSDPYIICEDADLEKAVASCMKGRFLNAGQSCISAKRLIVVAKIYEQFVQLLEAKIGQLKMGDPLDEKHTLGPMAREDLRDELHCQVEKSIKQGARLLCGGKPAKGEGFYYPATLLVDVPIDSVAFQEEIFGPVACVTKAANEKQAIELANKTSFGLGAAIFTQDLARGKRIAEFELEAGNCFVNDFVKSDPRLPFGGVKESGYGRELGAYGIMEFVNLKTVVVV